jgi:hypothetical protein
MEETVNDEYAESRLDSGRLTSTAVWTDTQVEVKRLHLIWRNVAHNSSERMLQGAVTLPKKNGETRV